MSIVLRPSVRRALIGLALLLAVGLRPASAQTCDASPSWVTSPSEPDFNTDPPTICAFYQYSWQSFLYLTSPAPGGNGALKFETFPYVSEVFGQGATLKALANKTVGSPTLFMDKRLDRVRTFQARGSKPPSDIAQAGSTGVLVDQNGNVTYYEQFLDPIAVGFIKACDLTITNCQKDPKAANLRFPAGALELKVSWRPLPDGTPNADSYYTLQDVDVFDPQTGRNVTVDLGLAGFHLVYTTPNHKEMVWATFEHVANAPAGPCTGPTTPPAGFKGWAFNNAASTDCSKINNWPYPPPPPAPPTPYPITQAFRNYAYGTDGSNMGKFNSESIQALNKSVLGIVPAGSVWSNYFLVGAVWTKGGVLPAILPDKPGANVAGSTLLSNATLETFTDWPNPVPAGGPTGKEKINCFSCHNAETKSTNPPNAPAFQLSHAFNNGNTTAACPYKDTPLPAACQNTQTLTVQLMSMHGKKSAVKK
jgi:hypothetical protein